MGSFAQLPCESDAAFSERLGQNGPRDCKTEPYRLEAFTLQKMVTNANPSARRRSPVVWVILLKITPPYSRRRGEQPYRLMGEFHAWSG
jgi:hypothetical protein